MNDLELLEQLFEQLPTSPFFIKDRDLRYVAANRAMALLCGVARPSDLYSHRVADFFPRALADSYEALDRQVILSERPITDVLHRSLEAGEAHAWLLFARVPVRDASGTCVGVAATSRRLRAGLISERSYERLARVSSQLRQEFDRPLRLTQLAAFAGTSASQLERDFHKVFASTPREFLHRIRMQQARARLEDGLASVAAVAQECGYADHSAFTRRFVAEMGITPSAYKRRYHSGRTKPAAPH